MGFFSWITSDTQKSITNVHTSKRRTFPVFMVTQDGKVWREDNYMGYGEFGGKDIYTLIAELNGLVKPFDGNLEDPEEVYEYNDKARMLGIDLMYRQILTDGTTSYECGVDFKNWEMILPNGFTANQLRNKEGWKLIQPNGYGEFNVAAKNGIILPKLFEKEENIKKWDEFPYPENCPAQGFFY